jgi:hypothetical protein
MASEIVGLENLPTVYISKITLEDKSTESYKANVRLVLKDERQDGSFIWSGDSLFYDFMKVGVIMTSDPEMSMQLKNGQVIPLPWEIKNLPIKDERTKVMVHPISSFLVDQKTDERTFTKNMSHMIMNNVNKMDIYVYSFIDTIAAADHFKISMQGDLKNIYGSITSEVILENGKTPQNATIFRKPDGSIYYGPVHIHQGVYMAGSQHTDQPHPVLQQTSIKNVKIIDNRTKVLADRQMMEVSQAPIISDLYHSVNNNTHLSGVFMVNIKQFALTRTKNGRKLMEASPLLFRRFVNTIGVNSISIVKRQVKTVRMSNKAGTAKVATKEVVREEFLDATSDSTPNALNNTDNIQQIYLNSSPMIRYYQFIDDKNSNKTKGQFKYKVKISFVDRSQDFIDSIMNQASANLDSLKREVNRLNKRKSYDSRNDQLRSGVTISGGVVESVKSYYEILSYTKNLKEEEMRQMISNKLSLFTTGSYKAKTANEFVMAFDKLLTDFQSRFKISSKYATTTKPKNIKKSFMPNVIYYEKEFSEVINFQDYKRSFDYLGIQDNVGVISLSKSDLSSRGEQEIARFFKTESSLQTEEFEALDFDIVSGLKDLKTSKMNYFAPLSFYFEGEPRSLRELDKIDTQGLTDDFLKSKRTSMKIKMPSKTFMKKPARKMKKPLRGTGNRQAINRQSIPAIGRFKIKNRVPPSKINNIEETSSTIDSRVYLGDDSDFNTTTDRFEISSETVDKVQINKSLESAVDVPTNRNRLDYDLEAPNNVLSNMIENQKCTKQDLIKMPNHFKALIASRSDGVKNNILSAEGDVMRNPNTKVATEMLFQSIQQIEMLVGFQKDSKGMDLVSKPLWTRFDPTLVEDNMTVMCRMKYVEMPEIGIVPSEDFKLPVLNSIFVVTGQDLLAFKDDPLPQSFQNIRLEEANSDQLLAMTTNIVTQNDTRFRLLSDSPSFGNNQTTTPTRTTTSPTGRVSRSRRRAPTRGSY